MMRTAPREQENAAILLIHCPDQKGIVVSVTEFIFKNKGNILYLEQHVDAEKSVFFLSPDDIFWNEQHGVILYVG